MNMVSVILRALEFTRVKMHKTISGFPAAWAEVSYCHCAFLNYPLNSLWPSDVIWRHRSVSTLVQVIACVWRHRANTLTNIDLSSMSSSDKHPKAMSQEMPQPSITKISLNITYLKFHSQLPGFNELYILFYQGCCVTKTWLYFGQLGSLCIPHYIHPATLSTTTLTAMTTPVLWPGLLQLWTSALLWPVR